MRWVLHLQRPFGPTRTCSILSPSTGRAFIQSPSLTTSVPPEWAQLPPNRGGGILRRSWRWKMQSPLPRGCLSHACKAQGLTLALAFLEPVAASPKVQSSAAPLQWSGRGTTPESCGTPLIGLQPGPFPLPEQQGMLASTAWLCTETLHLPVSKLACLFWG